MWFGRFVFRDNSHIKDLAAWIENMKENYDRYTSYEHLHKYNPEVVYTLGLGEYLQDIIRDLVLLRSRTTSHVVCNR